MVEPGLDRHDWESEWQQLEPLVRDSPAETLPELHDLLVRLLPDREIHVVDSWGASMAQGILARMGVEMAAEDRPAAEIAETLGISEGSVRKQLARGREQLRKVLGKVAS